MVFFAFIAKEKPLKILVAGSFKSLLAAKKRTFYRIKDNKIIPKKNLLPENVIKDRLFWGCAKKLSKFTNDLGSLKILPGCMLAITKIDGEKTSFNLIRGGYIALIWNTDMPYLPKIYKLTF